MAIHLNFTSYNGVPLSYGRVIEIHSDYQTKQSRVILGGYPDKISRDRGFNPYEVLEAGFEMPDPIPENLLAYTYQKLQEAFPEMDFTEI